MLDAEATALRRAARRAGLRRAVVPTAGAVYQGRRRLRALTVFVVGGLLLAGAILALAPRAAGQTYPAPELVIGRLLAILCIFSLYAIAKEQRLRGLADLLDTERAWSAEMSTRVHEFTSLLQGAKAVNSMLELPDVLDTILANLLGLFSGASGSILLHTKADELVTAAAQGNDRALGAVVLVGQGIAGRVAECRTPVLVNGPATSAEFPGHQPPRAAVDSAMSVPLLHRDELLGVLNVSAEDGRRFDDDDLRLLALFAEQAASGIMHARLHDEERNRVNAMVKLEQLKSDFIAGVSHDLRTPLTSIVGCTTMARRPNLRDEQRAELLEIAESQSLRLATMVEQLLTASVLGQDCRPTSAVPLDVCDLIRQIASTYEARLVTLDLPDCAWALADPDGLHQIVTHLVDNALRHARSPVGLSVEQHADQIVLNVTDGGPGVPVPDRDRIFERFVRLDDSRSQPGIGLGLALARGLAQGMGAAITVGDSAAGGALFQVSLVAAPVAASGMPRPRLSAEDRVAVPDGTAA